MAYGENKRSAMEKRMVSLGRMPMDDDLTDLRGRCLEALDVLCEHGYPSHITDPRASKKELDEILSPAQVKVRKSGLSSVWAEKMRRLAHAAIFEQWKRGQGRLFGKFKHIGTRGEHPMKDGHLRLVNVSEEVSRSLSDEDVAALQDFADQLPPSEIMSFFQELRFGDAGLSPHHASVFRGMMEEVNARFSRPGWTEESSVQLHLDNRCFRGGAGALTKAREDLTKGLVSQSWARTELAMTSTQARGKPIGLRMGISPAISNAYRDRSDQEIGSFVVELSRDHAEIKGVVVRPEMDVSVVGATTLVGEDFGYRVTSSLVVARSKDPVSEELVEFAQSDPGKKKVRTFLEGHVSGDEIEILERIQMSGRRFLDLIKSFAKQVDVLRSEIDRCYNRLDRIREEINLVAGVPKGSFVPEEPMALASNREQGRYLAMHGRFFRLLGGIQKLKAKRRAAYRKVAAVKKSWLGHVSNVKIRLAEKYGAAVVSEDLTVLTIPKDDPDYKGRTFNKMINNGAKGQYIRRSEDKMRWRGIAHIKVPSFYSSSTDWRTGCVDKDQRKGPLFKARDGTTWDADDHAGEMLARWLFLKPKAGQDLPIQQ